MCPKIVAHEGVDGNPDIGLDPVSAVPWLTGLRLGLEDSWENDARQCGTQTNSHVSSLAKTLNEQYNRMHM